MKQILQLTYRSCLSSLLFGRRIWVELICRDAGLFRLIDHEVLGILGSNIAVGVASCFFSTLLPELRRVSGEVWKHWYDLEQA